MTPCQPPRQRAPRRTFMHAGQPYQPRPCRACGALCRPRGVAYGPPAHCAPCRQQASQGGQPAGDLRPATIAVVLAREDRLRRRQRAAGWLLAGAPAGPGATVAQLRDKASNWAQGGRVA